MQTIKKTWNRGLLGKLFVGCAGLIILSCLCAVPLAIFGALTGDSDATSTPPTPAHPHPCAQPSPGPAAAGEGSS